MRGFKGWATVSMAALLAACSSSSEDDPVGNGGSSSVPVEQHETLKIATWFAAPGELEALQELINDYQASYPGARVEIVTTSIGPGPRNLQLHAGDATTPAVEWDVAYQMLPFLSQMTDIAIDLSSVDSLSDALAGTDPALQGALQVGGMVPGLPIAVDRLNTMIHNLGLMTQPPKNLSEFRAVCQAYVDGGKTGPKPYVAGVREPAQDARMYLVTLLGMLPADLIFQRDTSPAEELGAALSALAFYRDNDCLDYVSDDDASGANWDEAMQSLIDDRAQMVVQPDWGVGYCVANGQRAGTDYATGTLLADNGAYVYTAEFLSGNAASSKRKEIVNFLGVAGRLSTQLSYAAQRGALPAQKVANPTTEITDPGTLAVRLEFDQTAAEGRLGTMPPWIASATKPANFLVPLMRGEKSVDEVVQGYLCGDNAPYSGYSCP